MMKKIVAILLALVMLSVSAALAEDLSALSDEELLDLYTRIQAELETRKISSQEKDENGSQACGEMDEAVSDRLASFFYYWSVGNLEEMLPLCSSDWKAGLDNPKLELFVILGNRTPLSFEATGMTSDAADRTCMVTVVSDIDRNNGSEPMKYLLHVLMMQEADGLWYVYPASLRAAAIVEPESEPAPESVSAEGLPTFATFSEAAEAAGETDMIGGTEDYLAAAFCLNGRYLRAVTLLDDRARELYDAAMEAENFSAAMEVFDSYAWSLPVSYVEELEPPMEAAELDALSGKTVRELKQEGYFLYAHGGGEATPVVFTLSFGLYNYDFDVDVTYEAYLERMEKDDLEDVKVKHGRFSGFSGFATDLNYHADGTMDDEASDAGSSDASWSDVFSNTVDWIRRLVNP